MKFLVYWMGGSSEIQVKQAIGRGTRITPDKNSCYVVDFWVNSPERHPTKIGERRWGVGAHAEERVRIYNELYGPVVEDKLVFE